MLLRINGTEFPGQDVTIHSDGWLQFGLVRVPLDGSQEVELSTDRGKFLVRRDRKRRLRIEGQFPGGTYLGEDPAEVFTLWRQGLAMAEACDRLDAQNIARRGYA